MNLIDNMKEEKIALSSYSTKKEEEFQSIMDFGDYKKRAAAVEVENFTSNLLHKSGTCRALVFDAVLNDASLLVYQAAKRTCIILHQEYGFTFPYSEYLGKKNRSFNEWYTSPIAVGLCGKFQKIVGKMNIESISDDTEKIHVLVEQNLKVIDEVFKKEYPQEYDLIRGVAYGKQSFKNILVAMCLLIVNNLDFSGDDTKKKIPKDIEEMLHVSKKNVTEQENTEPVSKIEEKKIVNPQSNITLKTNNKRQNACLHPVNQQAAMNIVKKYFEGKKSAPYKVSLKNDHIGKYIQLNFVCPVMAGVYTDLIKDLELKIGYRIKVNNHTNTALLQTEFLKMAMKKNILIKKPAAFTNDTAATIYVSGYNTECRKLKEEIFNTYGVIVNFMYCD